MSECRALTNIIGNGVATVVVSAWERELDRKRLAQVLQGGGDADELAQAGQGAR
ncbi:C4-dicarboxylate transport protein [compost metagenome]